MNDPWLIVEPVAYELRIGDRLLTRLDGGAAALLSGAGPHLGELDIEAAIERAEEWLMPFSKLFQDLSLNVCDRTGRTREYFGKQSFMSPQQVEQAFTRVHDAVAHMRAVPNEFVADIVLLRELAHHGRLSGVRVLSEDSLRHPVAQDR